jgi:LPS-assembly protein
VGSPIVPPYDRCPSVSPRYQRTLVNGFDRRSNADYTRSSGRQHLTGQPNAQRTFALAQISRPWQTPSSFVTPKLQLHATQLPVRRPAGQRCALGQPHRAHLQPGQRPGVRARRQLLRPGLRQTLEPRAFYTYTPYRDQSQLPNYDSAANDFNFATIYTENAFGGNDRISDNNLLTLGVTTPAGSRHRRRGRALRHCPAAAFQGPERHPARRTPVSERFSDVLLGASLNWTTQWGLTPPCSSTPRPAAPIRSTIGARYSPGNYRVVSAAYRCSAAPASSSTSAGSGRSTTCGEQGAGQGPGRGPQGEGAGTAWAA